MLHDPDAQRRAIARDGGADDETDGGVVQDLLLAAGRPRGGEAFEEGREQVRFLRVDGDELSTAALDRLDLAVDVAVVEADDGKPDACGRCQGGAPSRRVAARRQREIAGALLRCSHRDHAV